MLKIKYSKEGVAFSDFDLLLEAEKIIDFYNKDIFTVINVSTGNILEALRVMVSRGKIPHDEIKVFYGEFIITITDKFEWSHYPNNFLGVEKQFLRELIEVRKNMKMYNSKVYDGKQNN